MTLSLECTETGLCKGCLFTVSEDAFRFGWAAIVFLFVFFSLVCFKCVHQVKCVVGVFKADLMILKE